MTDTNTNQLDFKSVIPLYFQLKELIKRRIADNIWKQGQMIPSENEMAELFGVSPGTVKNAFSELCKEGVLYRRQGKGTFISKPDFSRSFFRFCRYGLGKNEEGSIPNSRVLESLVMTPPPRVRETLNLDTKDKVIKIKRLRIMKNVPLIIEDLYLPEHMFRGFDRIDISQKLLYPIYDEDYGIPIIWADEFLEPRVADKTVAEALEINPGDPLMFVKRIAYTYGDKPVEFRSGFGRGDRFHYHIQIR